MAVASADWLGKGRGLSRLGRSPVTQVAGRVLTGKFERVSGRLLKGRRRGLGEGHREQGGVGQGRPALSLSSKFDIWYEK